MPNASDSNTAEEIERFRADMEAAQVRTPAAASAANTTKHTSAFLNEQQEILNGRGTTYNRETRLRHFQDVAAIWSVILGVEVRPAQVADCQIAAKLVRLKNGPHHDSRVDIANYSLIGDSLE